jgi:outer membrane protein TolC
MRADVAVAHADADLEVALADDANASEALRVECRSGDAALATTVPQAPSAIDPKLTDPSVVAELARHERSDLRSAQLVAQAADAAVRGARASGFPSAVVSAGYQIGTDSGVPVSAPSIGATLTIPLSGAAHERVALAAAQAAEAQAKAAAVERAVTLDAAASARNLGAAERAAAATTHERQAAEIALHATEVGYRNGASSSLDVTTARATYEQAVIDELTATYDREKARATLAIEVGA